MINAVQGEISYAGKDKVNYWKGKGEVDFVVMEGMRVKKLVQVCWDINDVKTREREVAGLVEAMGSIGVDEGVVVTDDHFGGEEREGKRVRFVPLWCWLLRK